MVKRILFGLILFILFISPNFVFARSWGRIFSLSEVDLKQDQVLANKSGRLKLRIYKNSIDKENIKIKFKKLSGKRLKKYVPAEYRKVSSFYEYKIVKKVYLEQALKIYLKYNSKNKKKKSIFYWDDDLGSWEKLRTKNNKKKKFARAKTGVENLKIVVLEKKKRKINFEPVRKKNVVNPAIYSLAGALIDDRTGKVMYEKNGDWKLTLASMTKIMTANVIVDSGVDFNSKYIFQSWDGAIGMSVWLSPGDVVRVKDLFYTSLVKSANNATKALAHSTGFSDSEFAERMNDMAKKVGADSCSFYEPTGLDWRNSCSSKDYLKVAQDAFRKYKIMQATTTKAYSYRTLNGKWISMSNTNRLLKSGLYVTGGKTGYLPEIGMNLVTKARSGGDEIIAVIIGAGSYSQAVNDVEGLLRWGFDNWIWGR